MRRVVGARAGFYEGGSRAPSRCSIRHAWLTDLIETVHEASSGTYGRLRVHAELINAHGAVVGHNTVGLLMRRAGLAGLPRQPRGKRSGSPLATPTDLVRRDGPN